MCEFDTVMRAPKYNNKIFPTGNKRDTQEVSLYEIKIFYWILKHSSSFVHIQSEFKFLQELLFFW